VLGSYVEMLSLDVGIMVHTHHRGVRLVAAVKNMYPVCLDHLFHLLLPNIIWFYFHDNK